MGPIAPNEDNRRMVHVSQPNTTRQGLWIGPHVFHMKFDTIEVRVNTNRIYHRRLYTLHLFAFRLGRSEFSSSSWVFLLAMCPCMRLQLSSPSTSIFHWKILRDELRSLAVEIKDFTQSSYRSARLFPINPKPL